MKRRTNSRNNQLKKVKNGKMIKTLVNPAHEEHEESEQFENLEEAENLEDSEDLDDSEDIEEDDDEDEDSDDDDDLDDGEDDDDDLDDSDDDESVDGEIDDVRNDINLQDISDDEGIESIKANDHSDDNDDQDDPLFRAVSDDDHEETADNKDRNQTNVTTIRNDLKPMMISDANQTKVDEYEYDSSDEEDVLNTIGNIPYDWYKDYVHIGYDKDGRKIVKPTKNFSEIDDYFEQINNPDYWRTIRDELHGQNVILNDNDIDVIRRLKQSKCPDSSYNPYESFIDFFTYEKMIHPVTNRPEPKAAFIPSLSEKRIVSRLVSAIKRARLKPKPLPKRPKPFEFNYDLWDRTNDSDDQANKRRLERYIAAPKMAMPGHAESYNPPPEYLFTEEEEKEWLEQEPEERRLNFIPRSYRSLRQVPAYSNFIRERFDRCLDLYLCPRQRKNRLQVNPEDLIPELPKPSDLQPFPSVQSMVYEHADETIVTCVTAETRQCQFIASGDRDGCVKIWDMLSGRCMATLKFSSPIIQIEWSPSTDKTIMAIVVDDCVHICNIGFGQRKLIEKTDEYFDNLAEEIIDDQEQSNSAQSACKWSKLPKDHPNYAANNVRIEIKHLNEVKQFVWHQAGEYFATLVHVSSAVRMNQTIAIHHLSKMKSQLPFKKINDTVKCIEFHPTKAYFFVVTRRIIRIYDLIRQQMVKKLQTNLTEITSISIHPNGDNLLISSHEQRVQWYDMDLSLIRPYKTMHYHKKSVRCVRYHRTLPLFASTADDGSIVVCHGMVYDDLLQNPLIVPVKVLRVKNSMAAKNKGQDPSIRQCLFHPRRPWLFATASNTIRMFT